MLKDQIADALRADIREGKFAAGDSLPTERELAARFNASPGTVRLALQALVIEGTIVGGRGAPKVVLRAPVPATSFQEFRSFAQWAFSRGSTPGGQVIEQHWREATETEASVLRLCEGDPVLAVVRTRTLDGRTVLLERTAYPQAIGELVFALPVDCPSVTEALADHGVQFTRADHSFTAVGATAEDARLLGIAEGAPLMSHHRASADRHGTPLEYSNDRYLSDILALAVTTSEHSNPLRWIELEK